VTFLILENKQDAAGEQRDVVSFSNH